MQKAATKLKNIFLGTICSFIFIFGITTAWGVADGPDLDHPRSDQIWAKELVNFVGDIGNVQIQNGEYDEVPSTRVEISNLHNCIEDDVVFVIHFLSTGRYVTQFRLPGKETAESVRLVAKQLFKSENGSDKELEAGRILRTQAYISRIVPLVEEDSKSRGIAKVQVERIRNLCSDPSLVNDFLQKIKPKKNESEENSEKTDLVSR